MVSSGLLCDIVTFECLPGGMIVECLVDSATFGEGLGDGATDSRSSIDVDTTDNGLADCDMASNDLYSVVAAARGMDNVGIKIGDGSDAVTMVGARVLQDSADGKGQEGGNTAGSGLHDGGAIRKGLVDDRNFVEDLGESGPVDKGLDNGSTAGKSLDAGGSTCVGFDVE
jgi:hypothetical protein